MHSSDEHSTFSSGDSFWDIGQYKPSVKRIEDGLKLSSDLISMLQERCCIEEGYAKSLRSWSKKWNEKIEKGPEYGSMQDAWRAPLVEAERISTIHLNIRDRILNQAIPPIKDWQKENFHKSVMGVTKESKEMDELFRKTQKPWAKLLKRVIEAKKAYHLACKGEKSAILQENNAKNDTSKSIEEQHKLSEKVSKFKEDVIKTREKYQAALKELNGYNAKYMEDMKEVFEKCQGIEEARLRFFQQTFFKSQECLDLTREEDFSIIFEDFKKLIQASDIFADLKWFSNNYGVGMTMNWPIYEDYLPELHNITKKSGKTGTMATADVTSVKLTGIYKKNEGYPLNEERFEINNNNNPANHKALSNGVTTSSVTTTNTTATPLFMQDSSSYNENNSSDSYYPSVDMVSVKVVALYDYEAQEDDEISFKEGDKFEKLEEKDEQGWCKGRINGKAGLYPAEYAQDA